MIANFGLRLFFCLFLVLPFSLSSRYKGHINSESAKEAEEENYIEKPDKKLEYEDQTQATINFTNYMFVDKEKTYFVQWKTNDTHVVFEVQVKTLGWVGLGISPNGGMTGADIAVMWIENGKLTLQDRFARGFFEPDIDKQQDWIPLYHKENATHTTVRFARLLDTCDKEQDRKITRDTIHLIYAYHSQDPPHGKLMKHEVRGNQRIMLVGSTPTFEKPKSDKILSLTAENYEIPHENKTSYTCFLRQMKGIKKNYNLIGAGATISPGNERIVHHILVHLCEKSFKNPEKVDTFLCHEDFIAGGIMRSCYLELLTIWAVGTNGYVYPENVGFPIKKEHNNHWVVLEIHYNNPTQIKGLSDDSGMELYLSDSKGMIDSGQLFIGWFEFLFGLVIPPQQKQFKITSFCTTDCMNKMDIPEEGLDVFAYFLHTHLAGRKINLYIIRDGKQMEPIFADDDFDFDYQYIRNPTKPVKIMKGDALYLECIYSTMDRENITHSGFSTMDEMCLAYLYYYPKRDLTLCGSVPTYEDLLKNLHIDSELNTTASGEMFRFTSEPSTIKIRDDIVDQLNHRNWNDKKEIDKLNKIYEKSKHEEVCKYMTIPKVNEVSMPKFKFYQKPDDACLKE